MSVICYALYPQIHASKLGLQDPGELVPAQQGEGCASVDRVAVVPICVCMHLTFTRLDLAINEKVVSRLSPSSM